MEKKPDPRNNGIPFNSETGSIAGKKAKGIPKFQLKKIAKTLLNRNGDSEAIGKIRKHFKIDPEVTNGEAFLQICIIKGMKTGNIDTFAKVAEMAGQFEPKKDIPINPTINISFNKDETESKQDTPSES